MKTKLKKKDIDFIKDSIWLWKTDADKKEKKMFKRILKKLKK